MNEPRYTPDGRRIVDPPSHRDGQGNLVCPRCEGRMFQWRGKKRICEHCGWETTPVYRGVPCKFCGSKCTVECTKPWNESRESLTRHHRCDECGLTFTTEQTYGE